MVTVQQQKTGIFYIDTTFTPTESKEIQLTTHNIPYGRVTAQLIKPIESE